MKRVLIISPHFPPINAADMQRVRQSLPFLSEFGWDAEVVTVDPSFVEAYSTDELLLSTIPHSIPVHRIKAWKTTTTRRFGLGSLSMRSFFNFRKKGNELLSQKRFDLIYFSTTAFHVIALGPYWKRKYSVPFVVDIQDPWRNDFYLNKPRAERPPKFRINYAIDKNLEKYTIPKADGVISVSEGYIETFFSRYKSLDRRKFTVIPFGGSEADFKVVAQCNIVPSVKLLEDKINVVYVGRGGHDLQFALRILFEALKNVLDSDSGLVRQLHFWFIGTSYAPKGSGKKTIETVANEFGVSEFVTEITDRLPYFETLALLKNAEVLFVPGSTDTSYTASKIYPYILAQKPLFGIFYKGSSVVNVINETRSGEVICFDNANPATYYTEQCAMMLKKMAYPTNLKTDFSTFETYTSKSMTKKQVEFFDQIQRIYNEDQAGR